MKKKIVAVLLASVMALSLSACGGSKTDSSSSKSDTKKEKTVKSDKKSDEATTEDSSDKANSSESESSDQGKDSASSTSDTQTVSSLDMDKCISDLKANLPLDPDYTYVNDFYGGLYTRYNALVGVAPASKTNSQKDWFVYDGISGGKVMLKLNKQYR